MPQPAPYTGKGRHAAMVVDRLNASGAITGNTNVVVAPGTAPPGQLLPHLKGLVARLGATHEHDSPTTTACASSHQDDHAAQLSYA